MKNFKTLLLFSAITVITHVKAQVTYNDVASIFYESCATCHHAGGIAPFALMNYSETSAYSVSIDYDLKNDIMPPWQPDTTYTRHLNEEIITEANKNLILQWITDGTLEGDPNLVPTPPVFDDNEYKLCPEPDLILKMDPYTLGHDEGYDCFMLPTNLPTDRILRAFEVVPGNFEIVHHIVIGVGQQNQLSGTNTSGGCLQTGGLEMGTYVPNAAPTVYPDKAPLRCGMTFHANDYLNLQIHYAPGCQGKTDSTQVRLYFYPEGATNVREVYTTVDIDLFTLNIPANQVTTINGSVNIGQDRTILGIFPHSHLIASQMLIRGVSGGQPDIPLIRINRWEFNWAGYFYYKQLVKIPAGYTISADHTYDNTASNPNQFNDPPQNISWSTSTTGEMLYDAFQWLDYETGDENIDMEALLACDTLFVCRPASAGTISGTSTFCGSQTGLSYSVPTIPNAETYTWSYSGTGATINGTGSNITIDFSGSATSGDLTVEGVNECGVSGFVSAAYAITISGGGGVAAAGTISGTATVCEGETGVAYVVPTIANANSYAWSYSGTGATINGAGENVTIDFSASATSGDLTVLGESACGNGTASPVYSITVSTLPSVPTITAVSSCGSTELSSSTSAVGYAWSPGGETTQSITVTSDGTYSVTVGSGNCSATSAGEVVTIQSTPGIISTQDGIRCGDGEVVLEATASAGDPSWYDVATGGVALSTAISYTTTSLSATTTYYVDATDNGCTTATRTAVTATISDGPTATISGDATVCSGANGTLTIGLTGSSPWSFTYGSASGENPVSGITTATYTVLATAGTYTVSAVSDAGGCAGTASGTATITESTDVTVSNITKTCNGGGTGYTVEFDIAGGDAGSYAVTGDVGSLTTNTHFASSEITSGTQSTFNVSDGAGCNTVQVSEQKTCDCSSEGTLSGGGTICAGSDATITVDLLGTSPWSITYAIDGVDEPAVTGITTSPYTFTTTTTGDYTLSSVSDATCTGSAGGTATVSQTSPTATISGGGAICDDGSTTSITFELTGGSPPWSFTYSDGTITSALINSNFTTTSVQVSAGGNYTLVSVSAGACAGTGSGSAVVTVNSLPTIGATASPATVCSGESVTLNGTGGVSYAWSDGKTDGLAFTTTATATYTVTGTDGNGCSNTATQTVTVNEAPTITPNSTPSSAAVCIGQSVTLSGAATGVTNFIWTGGVIDGQAFVPTTTTTYTVSGTDGSGCIGTAVRTVSVFELPTVGATATPSATVCEGESVTLNGTGADSYVWSGGVIDGTAFVPTATATYTVTGSDNFSCENTATQEVVVESCNNTGVGIVASSTSSQRVLIYPNPTSGVLYITIKDADFSDMTITVENMLGSEVFTVSDNNNATDYSVELNLEDLQEGVYNLTISADDTTTIHKLVIQ